MKNLLLVPLFVFMTGCGVTGSVSQQEFPVLTNTPKFTSSVDSVQIITDSNTASNESYGAFNWGSFDDSDKKLIQESIQKTLQQNTINATSKATVHMNIHRYAQVITNASYASFVIIDWCLEQNGQIIVDEVFYAGHSDELNLFTGKSLGWAKGVTHKAISTRIINQTLQALSQPTLKNAYPEAHIFLDANDAVKALPTQLTSVGTSGYTNGTYYFVGSSTGNTDFDKKSAYKKVDWLKQIKLKTN